MAEGMRMKQGVDTLVAPVRPSGAPGSELRDRCEVGGTAQRNNGWLG